MKKILFVFTLVGIFHGLSKAQTAEEVVGKYIQALGGKEKISQVKSVYTEYTMEVMGNSMTQMEYLLDGKGYKTEAEFNGSKIVNCLNDKNGWMINPLMGSNDPQAMEDALYKAGRTQIFLYNGLLDYTNKGLKIESAGKEKNFTKLKVMDGGSESVYYFDNSTNLLSKTVSKSEMMGQQVEVTTTYGDYKKTDSGVVLPYTKNIDMGMFQLALKISKVEVNKEIDPQIFAMPK